MDHVSQVCLFASKCHSSKADNQTQRRHAPVTAKIWQQRLADSQAAKRLNLIYLANEVIQQSKARKKDDFLIAFSPIIPDATVTAFRGAPGDIQLKIRRVVDVWRQRAVFDPLVQQSIERSVDALEGARKKPMLGGSLLPTSGQGGVPSELQKLADLQTTLTRSELGIKPSLASSTSEYSQVLEPPADLKVPLPKQAAQLGALQKSLAQASDAVTASLTARKALLAELEALVKSNQDALQAEQEQITELQGKRGVADATRADVEDQIMKGLGEDDAAEASAATDGFEGGIEMEAERPEMEPLTPPTIESFTPPAETETETGTEKGLENEQVHTHTPEGDPPSPSLLNPPPAPLAENAPAVSSSLERPISSSGAHAGAGGQKRDMHTQGLTNGNGTAGPAKRRKMSHGDEVYEGLGEDDIDEDVKGLLA